MTAITALWLKAGEDEKNGSQFADTFSKVIFSNSIILILIENSLNFVAKHSFENASSLIQVMARCRTGANPLHGPMRTKFYNAMWRH